MAPTERLRPEARTSAESFSAPRRTTCLRISIRQPVTPVDVRAPGAQQPNQTDRSVTSRADRGCPWGLVATRAAVASDVNGGRCSELPRFRGSARSGHLRNLRCGDAQPSSRERSLDPRAARPGGAAPILRGTVDRGTNDLDSFIGAREMPPGAVHGVVEATEAALAEAGLRVNPGRDVGDLRAPARD
jgi:hypothetical protein